MLRRSSRKCVTYTKDELENMKFLELKKIAKQRNLSRRFTTKHEIIDSLLNFGLEDDLSLETLTLVDNSDSEHDNSTNENESKNLSPVIQTQEKNVSQPKRVVRKARRRFSKPRMTVFQLDSTENELSDELQKGNGRYFESPWHSVMTKSPEVSLNKSRASSAKKNKSLTQLLAGYCQPQSTTASPYPTRNRRSTRNFTPASSATRITRRTRANAESEQELYNTLNQSPYPKKYTAKKSFVTEPSMLEDEARSDVINKNRTTVGTALQYDTIQLEEQKSSEENKTEQKFEIDLRDKVNENEMSQIRSTHGRKKRSRFFKIEENYSPVIEVKQDFIIDELRNQESILSQSSVSPFEGTQNVQSGRRLRSRVVNAEIKASPIKEAKAVEEESPTLDETFEIIEEVDSSKVNIRDRGNVSNLRSLRASDKTSPSNELKTSKSQAVDEESPKHSDTFEIIDEVSHVHSPKVNLQRRRNIRNLRSRDSGKTSPPNEFKTSKVQVDEENPKHDETFEIIENEVIHVHSPKVNLRQKGNVRNLRSSRNSGKMYPSNELKTAEMQVEEENPKHDETFEIIENEVIHVHSPKVNLQQKGNVRNLRSSRNSGKMSPSNELITAEMQEKSDNKENESTVDLKLNGTYELPEAQNTTLPMLKEVSNSVKRRSRSFPRETSKKVAAVFFSPPNHEVNKRSQKKGTPLKHTRIPVPKFQKMPDFKKIHKKEFEKMESLVDNHERKLQRAKKLATPNKFGVMVFKGAQPTDKNDQLPKPAAQSSTGFQFNLHDRFIPQVNMKSWNVRPSPQPVKYFIQKQNVREVKEIITKKLPVHNRRENIREESRTKIRGVRLNRRFELQMAHRKIN